MNAPTLAGAQFGRVQPWREIEGGIWLDTKDKGLHRVPAAVRIVRRQVASSCLDYARQYLQGRADKVMLGSQLEEMAGFFRAHYALCQVPLDAEAPLVQMFLIPPTIVDATGKLIPSVVGLLPLHDLADGQLDRINREYDLLRATETPDRGLTHQEWEAIVEEGKTQPLATLHSRHGSSRLIQALHFMGAQAWPT